MDNIYEIWSSRYGTWQLRTDVSVVPSVMNVEVADTFETLETSYQTTRCYIPEDR